MIRLDAATVLLQWAVGGLLFLWVTTRRRQVGIGYGWLLRSVYGAMALGAFAVGVWLDPVPVREASSAAVAVAAGVALAVSIVRRKAGVAGERERVERRSIRSRSPATPALRRTTETASATPAATATASDDASRTGTGSSHTPTAKAPSAITP